MTKIINIFGAPGTGKSTTAAGLFAYMKRKGYIVELVTEYAKDMTWENRQNILDDQVYITAKQFRRFSRLIGNVDYIVTDSPIKMSLTYAPHTYRKELTDLVFKRCADFDEYNFLIKHGNKTYSDIGRNQTLGESKLIEADICNFLIIHSIDFKEIERGMYGEISILKSMGLM